MNIIIVFFNPLCTFNQLNPIELTLSSDSAPFDAFFNCFPILWSERDPDNIEEEAKDDERDYMNMNGYIVNL